MYDGRPQEVRTPHGIFVRGQPRRISEKAAKWCAFQHEFTLLIPIKYIGSESSRSIRLSNGRVIALLKDTPSPVPISMVYKLRQLPEFEFVEEEKLIPDSLVPSRTVGNWAPTQRIRQATIINASSLGNRNDGSYGALASQSIMKYRLGVFVARPQGYISGGYYHVWVTANVLCKFFDVTLVVPAMPVNYIKLIKHPQLKIVLDSNYLLDLGYSPFDMIMSLHGNCGEAATKYSTRYNVPVYLHCFEPGNLVEQKLLRGRFNDRAWGFRREMYKRVDYTVCSNAYTQEWTKEWIGGDPRKVVECIPPLNFKIADGIPPQEEKHEIVFISRMIDYKRPLDILEIAIRVDPTLTVNYIGAHSALNKKVFEVARRKGIRINFYDAITEEEKFKIIKQSKFMVFPSRFEGYGLPPAEALYCKKPCIAYDIPVLKNNYKDMLEFAEERNTLDLCKKAKRLLDDPEYRRRRGEEGREFIKDRLSFEACEKSYMPIMPPVRISFFIIVFEGADYLEACLKQLYPHAWEILIAEGAIQLMANHKGYFKSRDRTNEILDNFPDPENKIKIFRIDDRAWKSKAEMKSILLKNSTGHIIWQIDHDEFYKHSDIDNVIQCFIDDASLDVIDIHTHHFWKDYDHYRIDGKWGQVKFTRIWRKKGLLSWTYHDCPHRDGKPYRGTNFKGINIGRILYHYGYVREESSIEDKIEAMSARDTQRAKNYRREFGEWQEGNVGNIKVFEGKHPQAIREIIDEELIGDNNGGALQVPTGSIAGVKG